MGQQAHSYWTKKIRWARKHGLENPCHEFPRTVDHKISQPIQFQLKKILDSYILYQNGQLKYPEGRAIVLCNLSNKEKRICCRKSKKTRVTSAHA